MLNRTVQLLTALIACASAYSKPIDDAEWTPHMFGALPTHVDIKIAPDGKRVAMLRTEGDAVEVVVRVLDDAKAVARATRIEGASARYLHWAGNNTILVMVSQTLGRRTSRGLKSLFASRWLALSADTLKSKVLFGDEEGYYILAPGNLLSAPSNGDPRALFTRWTTRRDLPAEQAIGTRLSSKGSDGSLALFSVDLISGKDKILAIGSGNTIGWQVTPDGEPAVRVDSESVSGNDASSGIRLHVGTLGKGGEPTSYFLADPSAEVSSLSFAGLSSGDAQPVVTGLHKGTRGVWRYDLQSGQIGKQQFWNEQYDIEEVVHDHHASSVRGVRYIDDLPRMHYFDPADQRRQEQLSAAMPDAAPMLWSSSADGTRSIVKVQYNDHPPQWFLHRPKERKLDMIAPAYAALDGKRLPAKSAFDYSSSDGLNIPGYLTVPLDDDGAPKPLVVLVHGGPQARDDLSFDYWSAFYAARGYLVYQPNFRGSDGYGAAFRQAGDGEWGGRIQQDIDEGVRRLIKDGRALAGRVCIVGASFGGYAALVGATMSDGLYACAVSVNGIANVGDMFDFHDPSGHAFWERRIGKRYDRAKLRQISPMHRAVEARTPILLIHGKDDVVVPFGQSRAMAKALAAHGKSGRLIELAGEDHWLSTASSRIETLRRSIEFIDSHIGAAGDAGS